MSQNLKQRSRQCIQYTTDYSIDLIRQFIAPNYSFAWIHKRVLVIRLPYSDLPDLIVRPTDWIFKTLKGTLYIMTNKKYKSMYIDLEEYKSTVEVIKVSKNGKRPARRFK